MTKAPERRRHAVIAWMLAFAVWLAGPAAALAQSAADVAMARELFNEGLALSKAKKWEEAREKLARSLALKRAPITLYTLGVAEMNSGRFVDALQHLHAFVAMPREPGTERFEGPASQAIADLEQRVGRVVLAVEPADAPDLVVTIDGEPVPREAFGRPRPVDPGKRTIAAEARGFHRAERTVSVAPAKVVEVKLALEPAPLGASPEAPALEPEPDAPSPRAPIEEDRPTESPSLVGPALLLAGGLAVAGAGVAVGLLAVQRAEDAPTSDGDEAEDARTMALAGDIGAGAGGLIAAAGLVWLIVALTSDGEPAGAVAPGTFRVSF